MPLPDNGTPASLTSRRRLQRRLALSYSGMFFACGVALLAIPNVLLFRGKTTVPAGGRASPGTAEVAAQQQSDVHQLLIGSAIALAVLVPVSLVLGWLAAGRLLRPLRAITATAQHISTRSLHQRLALGQPEDELTELGTVLDGLFARLEAAFTAQRHVVANVSHELRTPLAGQKTLLQVALADPEADAGTLRSACLEALTLGEQQEHLIDALLTLATSERGVGEWSSVDLADIAAGVLAARQDEAQHRGLYITAALRPAPAAGDRRLMESLVTNLVDNALHHNVPEGRVEIVTAREPERATIVVRNTGAVIPADQIERLFQPFQQLAAQQRRHGQGLGLGLAIVQAVADAHGATIAAQPRPGGGLDIEVRFQGC